MALIFGQLTQVLIESDELIALAFPCSAYQPIYYVYSFCELVRSVLGWSLNAQNFRIQKTVVGVTLVNILD